MKAAALFFLLLLPVLSSAQWTEEELVELIDSFDKEDPGNYKISKVFQADSISKEALFSAAQLHVADGYKSSKDVTQMQDRETGVIVVKAWREPLYLVNSLRVQIWYTLTLRFKDGRFKATMSRITVSVFSPDMIRSGEVETKNPLEAYFKVGWLKKSNGKIKENRVGFLQCIYASLVNTIDGTARAVLSNIEADDDW